MTVTAMGEIKRWQDIDPIDAVGVDLRECIDITAPLNERFERCPWPWYPKHYAEPLDKRCHCPFCGALCIAGEDHTDYAYVPVGWLLETQDAAA